MEKNIAVCGIDCAACPALIASKTNDNDLRKKIAEEWGKAYNFAFTPEMINCHGCHATDGVQIGHCGQCEMRLCSIKKGASDCGACASYPCKTITDFHAICPGTKENLAALRA